MSEIVRAIDVGYGQTKYVATAGERSIRCDQFPSVAAISEHTAKRDAIGGTRKTVALAINGITYEVGPDVHLVGRPYPARKMDDGYYQTPEHLALIRGALAYMNVEAVHLLVLGLPVHIFKQKGTAQSLKKRVKGEHDVGDGRTVRVEDVQVVAQPSGALVCFGAIERRMADLRSEKSLIIDAGARTFDWLVTQGMRVVEGASNSVARGMHDVLRELARGLARDVGVEVSDLDRIDRALRSGTNPKFMGTERSLSKHLRTAKAITDDAVAEMKHYVGNGHDIDNIVLGGGGAFFFLDAIAREFPGRQVRVLDDAVYANVRGFQIAGMDLGGVRPARTSAVEAPVGAE